MQRAVTDLEKDGKRATYVKDCFYFIEQLQRQLYVACTVLYSTTVLC